MKYLLSPFLLISLIVAFAQELPSESQNNTQSKTEEIYRKPGILGPGTNEPTGADADLYRDFAESWAKDRNE